MDICGVSGCANWENLKLCGRCKLRKYCCEEHQKNDWKQHKLNCIPSPQPSTSSTESTLAAETAPSPNTLEERSEIARSIAQDFIQAISRDLYPTETIETLFGIVMEESTGARKSVKDYSLGALMLQGWKLILTVHAADVRLHLHVDDVQNSGTEAAIESFTVALTNALPEGGMPSFFQGALREGYRRRRELMEESGQRHGVVAGDDCIEELMRRGFASIPWDDTVLAALAGTRQQ